MCSYPGGKITEKSRQKECVFVNSALSFLAILIFWVETIVIDNLGYYCLFRTNALKPLKQIIGK